MGKYDTIEDLAIQERSRYNRRAECYCYLRINRAKTREHYMFWLNMHYIYLLMQEVNPQRYL